MTIAHFRDAVATLLCIVALLAVLGLLIVLSAPLLLVALLFERLSRGK